MSRPARRSGAASASPRPSSPGLRAVGPRSLKTPSLQVTDRGRPRTSRALLRRIVRAALEHGGAPQMPVSLLLTDDAEIASIHGRFLGDSRPTDVISFAIEGAAEIAVSVETAARCARAGVHEVAAEVALYVVHGLLHLCGYDDRHPRARARMRRAERDVLATLGLTISDVDT